MRNTMKYILTAMILIIFNAGYSQERYETIRKEIPVTPNNLPVLWIDNINGSINVEGISGTSIIMEVKKWIKSSSKESLEKSWNQLNIKIDQGNDSIIVYVDASASVGGDGTSWATGSGPGPKVSMEIR